MRTSISGATPTAARPRHWFAFYNDRRLHQALGYRTPMAVWREGMQAAKAGDMMDNADALTTCPQRQQQTEPLAA
jgi:putative transposase